MCEHVGMNLIVSGILKEDHSISIFLSFFIQIMAELN